MALEKPRRDKHILPRTLRRWRQILAEISHARGPGIKVTLAKTLTQSAGLGRFQLAIQHFDDAIRAPRQLHVMGDNQEGRTILHINFTHEFEDAAADFVSRLPVGSSARTRARFIARERAMATRCCWPPDRTPAMAPAALQKSSLPVKKLERALEQCLAPRKVSPSNIARVLGIDEITPPWGTGPQKQYFLEWSSRNRREAFDGCGAALSAAS